MVLIVSAKVLYWPMLIVFTSVDIIADKGMCIIYKLLTDLGYYFIFKLNYEGRNDTLMSRWPIWARLACPF